MIYGSNNSPPPFYAFNNSRNFCGLVQDCFKNRESIVFHFHVSFCFPRSKWIRRLPGFATCIDTHFPLDAICMRSTHHIYRESGVKCTRLPYNSISENFESFTQFAVQVNWHEHLEISLSQFTVRSATWTFKWTSHSVWSRNRCINSHPQWKIISCLTKLCLISRIHSTAATTRNSTILQTHCNHQHGKTHHPLHYYDYYPSMSLLLIKNNLDVLPQINQTNDKLQQLPSLNLANAANLSHIPKLI